MSFPKMYILLTVYIFCCHR